MSSGITGLFHKQETAIGLGTVAQADGTLQQSSAVTQTVSSKK